MRDALKVTIELKDRTIINGYSTGNQFYQEDGRMVEIRSWTFDWDSDMSGPTGAEIAVRTHPSVSSVVIP